MTAPAQPDPPEHGQLLVYSAEDGQLKIDVRLEGETAWLTQQHMADLFQTTQQNISLHLQNIYEEGELQQEATHKEFLSVRQEGSRHVSRSVEHYNLDAIISVGYRVKSAVATRFRIWATQKLREFIVKGFVLDDERLKNPHQPFDYFDELLRRIQDIRTSERRFYQKITDIYATSIDYDPTQPESIEFFQTVQNKMHWAITGQTAAEIIHGRADSAKPNMGLTNWRGAKVRKEDVAISEQRMDAVIDAITLKDEANVDDGRPDIAMIFSADPAEAEFVDVVVVEIKTKPTTRRKINMRLTSCWIAR